MLLLAATMAVTAVAVRADGPKAWQLDPDHSDAHFQVRHLGITNIQGDFPKLSGTLLIDDQDLSKSSVDVTIDVASIYTRVPARDEDLRGKDFFDVAKYPTASFHSTKLVKSGDILKMTGNLTLHGVTKAVTFDVMGPTAPVMFMGEIHRGATATATIRRRDFGVSGDYPTVSDDVLLTLDVDVILKK
jgi:polyisoprenoid-binding protein YceI